MTLFHARPTRRQLLGSCAAGLCGLSLPDWFGLRARAAGRQTDLGSGKAKACIVLYCWGGMSHIDTWDPKPDAPAEIRGEFKPIASAVPGIQVGEHMPLLARQMKRIAIVRSMHHRSTAHGKGMYWNMTGHEPPQADVAVNLPPSLHDWPNLGSMVAKLRTAPRGLPGAVQLPYPLVDNGTLQAGDGAGFLGAGQAPLLFRPSRGKPYGGVSRDMGALVLQPAEGVDSDRLRERVALAGHLERLCVDNGGARSYRHFQEKALDLLLDPEVQATLDLEREPPRVRDRYGDHVCGQSMLQARRLVEAGVPLVTVVCAAGDLNGSAGDHWDTHGDNFNRLKRALLPPLESACNALLDDLADRGLLEQTLVVWLTEFGRTPQCGNGGRDHYPFCYSVALAGGGIRGGQVYGSSDRQGALPRDLPCGPNDLHATIFHALGIPLDSHLTDFQGRPQAITDGRPLPLA
jgi:uncharacterized protein (DUF1501 family)